MLLLPCLWVVKKGEQLQALRGREAIAMSSAVGQELRHLIDKCMYNQLQVYHEKRWGNKHSSLCKHSDLFLVTHKSQPNHTPDTKVTYWSIWKGLHSSTQNVAPKWRMDIEKWKKSIAFVPQHPPSLFIQKKNICAHFRGHARSVSQSQRKASPVKLY